MLDTDEHVVQNMTGVEAIVKVNDDKSIRYLMVGAILKKEDSNSFYGMVYDYTGGGEYSDFFFEDNAMIDAEEVNSDFFNGKYPSLWDKIDRFLEEQEVVMDEVGNYIYSGKDKMVGIKVVGTNIKPIEVGNTIFESK